MSSAADLQDSAWIKVQPVHVHGLKGIADVQRQPNVCSLTLELKHLERLPDHFDWLRFHWTDAEELRVQLG